MTQPILSGQVSGRRWFERLARWLEKRGQSRMIYREQEKYLERFYVLSTSWLGIYLHRFWSSDDDGLHDHPWNSASILLAGGYHEEEPERQGVPYGPTVTHFRRPFHPPIKLRSRYAAHRITVPSGTEGKTWSLFVRFGFKRRAWGFYRNRQWEPALVQCRKEENGN